MRKRNQSRAKGLKRERERETLEPVKIPLNGPNQNNWSDTINNIILGYSPTQKVNIHDSTLIQINDSISK